MRLHFALIVTASAAEAACFLKLDANYMPLCGAIWSGEPAGIYSCCFLFLATPQNLRMLARIELQSRSTSTGCGGSCQECKKNSKEALIEQLHTFSQTLRPFAALWNKWNTAQQLVGKTTKHGINKPCRRALPHREISTIISCGFKMNSLRFGAVYS